MAGRSAPEWATLKLRVPRGFEDFWALIRARNESTGCFTTAEIAAETNVQRQSVEHYVARLVAGGFAKRVKQRREGAIRVNVYSLVRAPKVAPRISDDGVALAGTAQEQLWRAMRSLKLFGTRELAYAATVDRVIPLKTAQRYVNELSRAGYLTAQNPRGAKRPALYRLKPSMNTGPLPPSVLVTEAVWDRNLKTIVGEPQASLRDGAA